MTIVIDLPADTLAALYADEDDEEAAVGEALEQLSKGQGRPLSEYAGQANARFAALYGEHPPGKNTDA